MCITHVWHIVDSAQALATKLIYDNEGVFMFIIIVYASNNQAARQAFFIVIRESFGWELVQENYMDIQKTLNNVADIIWYIVFHLWFILSLTLIFYL